MSCPPTNVSLVALLIQLIQYQETYLGRNSSNPRVVRIPMRCFLDFNPGGSVCRIFSMMFDFKAEQNWAEFQFNDCLHAAKC